MRETADERRESDAVTNARHRVAQLAESFGTRHPEYATGLNQLALLLIMQGDPDSSEPLLREALEIRREALGERHPDFATNLSSLGGLLWARGALDQAEPLLRQAVEVRRATLGPAHPKTVVSLNSLDQLLKLRGESAPEPGPALSPAPVSATPPPHPRPADEPVPVPASVSPTAAVSTPEVSSPVDASPAPAPAPDEPAPAPAVVPPALDPEAESSPRVPGLELRLSRLADDFKGLGDRLSQAGVRLLKSGRPPADDLVPAWESARNLFLAFKGDLATAAGELSVPLPPGGLDDLDAAAAFLPALRDAEAARSADGATRRKALAVLARVDALRCPGDPGFTPLSACRERAADLARAIEGRQGGAGPDEVDRLVDGTHPLALLLALVCDDPASGDAEWADRYDAVVSSFGNGLAVAAARSRIVEGVA